MKFLMCMESPSWNFSYVCKFFYCNFLDFNFAFIFAGEFVHAFNLSHPKVVFTSPYAVDKVVTVAKDLSFIKQIVLFGDEKPADTTKLTLFDEFIQKYKVRVLIYVVVVLLVLLYIYCLQVKFFCNNINNGITFIKLKK